MTFTQESFWSLGVLSHSFQERHVVGILGASLAKVYGEPQGQALPDHLAELVRRFEEAEHKASSVFPASLRQAGER
jgi:hypothetical protein